MVFYQFNLMQRRDPDLCFLHSYPEGMGLKTHKLLSGLEVLPGEYPDDARIYMSENEPGMVVPDLISNTCRLLIVSKRLKEAFEGANRSPVQYLPIAIYNHKKRPASTEHFIVNPLGTVDILDTNASQIKYLNGDVVSVDTYVLDPEKGKAAPDLFRLKEEPSRYVMSEKMLAHLRQTLSPKPTNVTFFFIEPPGA